MQPFRGIFPAAEGENGSVLDFAVLFAMIVYGILTLVLQSAIGWLDRRIAGERAKVRWLSGDGSAPA